MSIQNMSLKYTKAVVPVLTLATGLQSWKNIEGIYRNGVFRDKVICRIDMVQYLQDMFCKETIKKYRQVLYNLASMSISDVQMISEVLIELAKIDEKFANTLTEFYYTKELNMSFGEYILKSMAHLIISQEDRYRSFFRGRKEVVICISDGYLYFSIPDDDDYIMLPDNVEYEVVSYAKNWTGKIKYAER